MKEDFTGGMEVDKTSKGVQVSMDAQIKSSLRPFWTRGAIRTKIIT